MTKMVVCSSILFLFACEPDIDLGKNGSDVDGGDFVSEPSPDAATVQQPDATPVVTYDCGEFEGLSASFDEDGVFPDGWSQYGPNSSIIDDALQMNYPASGGAFSGYGQGISTNSTFELAGAARLTAKLAQPAQQSNVQTIIKAEYSSESTWAQVGLNESGGFAQVFNGEPGEEINDWRDFSQDGAAWFSIAVSPDQVRIERSTDGTAWERVLELPGGGEGRIKIHLQSYQQFPSSIESVAIIEDFDVICETAE